MNYIYNKKAAIDRLEHEIRLSDITVALSHCNYSEPNNLEVVFKTALSAQDQAILNSLITNHIPLPLDFSSFSIEEIQQIINENT